MLNKKTFQAAFIKNKDKPLTECRVNMSNTLARAAHGLNLSEKRIIAMGLVKTDQVPSKALFLAQNQGWKIKLSATEYAEEFGLTHDTAYNQLKSASEKLWNRYIRYIVQTRRGPKEAKFRWISGVTYHHGEGWVELNFTPEVAPHLLALRKQFTSHKLKHACAFDSIYAWRLYECLKSWQDTGKYTPDIETFHEAMEAPPSCRQNFKALRIRVIEPAVSAIIEKSDLLVQWKPVKAGRKVIGLEFHFQPNPQINLPLETPESSSVKRATLSAARLTHSPSRVSAMQP
ncbi:Replication initiation protein RepB protein [Candidatus Glomeribacter gigasporarum BEG34]|uniref:Replication initiation protein n=2 Tax=cellular organisms TaxID=131567 RepID=A0A8H3ZYM5_GIGMA|nr:replication initiation protein [Candidatus Glomeribacter gigasporarum]KAF0333041.1 replication initiation protein [Gigaspora margarita]CCD30123.1 Replication initiation protein RepB protein [Candidatus Glomeribacter gigasporarum BEG34]